MAKGKYLPKTNPIRAKRDRTIIDLSLQGLSLREIEAKVGLSFQQISTILKDEDYKEILEVGHKSQILLLPKAINKVDDLISSEDEKVALQASQVVMKNTGITPAHTQTNYITQLYVDQRTMITPAMAERLVAPGSHTMDDPDIIEIEAEV